MQHILLRFDVQIFCIVKASRTISRVMSLDDHLSRTAVADSLKRPTWKQTGPAYRFRALALIWSCFGWGLHCLLCYHKSGSLLHCRFTLTSLHWRFLLCCTFLGVTSTGRYPASCPMKPGLSSPMHLHGRDHLSCLHLLNFYGTSIYRFPGYPVPNYLYREYTTTHKFSYQGIVW